MRTGLHKAVNYIVPQLERWILPQTMTYTSKMKRHASSWTDVLCLKNCEGLRKMRLWLCSFVCMVFLLVVAYSDRGIGKYEIHMLRPVQKLHWKISVEQGVHGFRRNVLDWRWAWIFELRDISVLKNCDGHHCQAWYQWTIHLEVTPFGAYWFDFPLSWHAPCTGRFLVWTL